MYTKKDFDKVLELLKGKKTKGKLLLTTDGELLAFLGFNYPDEMVYPFEDIMDQTGINVECMADASGYKYLATSRF